MSHVLVIGADGFLGSAIYHKLYPNVVGTTRRAIPDKIHLDIRNLDLSFLSENRGMFNHAIICIAKSNIAFCENYPSESYLSNVAAQFELVDKLIAFDITPVLFSSDYVFDGVDGNYGEESQRNPLNEYGRQKFELEKGLETRFKGQYLLIRSSKVFGLNKGDNTLLDQMASNLKNQCEIFPAFDQVFTPIFLGDMVEGILRLIQQNRLGLYNVSSPYAVSRYDVAIQLCDLLKCDRALVKRISLDDLGENFKRPKNTSMRCDRFLQDTKLSTVTVDECIAKVVSNYI